MNNTERLAEIERRLQAALNPETVDVVDESHEHVGHEGAKDGRGHFRVLVVSEAFRGKLPLARHRMIYAAMDELMQTDIHALAIDAYTPDEF